MRILLTNRELVNLGGSELVTVELAEELLRQGHEVTVYSPRIGGGALDVSHLNTTMHRPKTDNFDLLWIHHSMLVYDLGFRKREGQRIVFNHMSSYVPAEWPRIPSYENHIADLILANSDETRVKLVDLGLTDIYLFQNPAPIAFDRVGPGVDYGLFISNHRPDDLVAATQGIGIPCRWIGENDERVRITPEIMSRAAFVVANGKSVQLAMRAGVPVFVYDQFKGSGWDVMAGEKWNFSGRGVAPASLDTLHSWGLCRSVECESRFKLEVMLAALGVV